MIATHSQGRRFGGESWHGAFVRGLESLRVCDASVMPSIPCTNTMVPTVMLAERMADLIKSEARAQTG